MIAHLYPKLNPLIIREMRGRMRGRRAIIVFTIHLIVLGLVAGITYAIIYYDHVSRYNYSATYTVGAVSLIEVGPTIGKAIFLGSVLVLFALLSFIAPAFGAGALAGEKERQTYDTLLLTSLRPGQIVLGKVGAIFVLMLVFILGAIPVQGLAYFFGGIVWLDVLIATIAMIVTALALSAIGLFFSSLVRTTTMAVSLAYGLIIPVVYGLPFLIFFMIEGPLARFFDDLPNAIFDFLYVYTMYLLMSINPFFAAALTAESTSGGQGYLYLIQSSDLGPLDNRGLTLWLLSPWVVYVVFYAFVAALAIRVTICRVGRASRT